MSFVSVSPQVMALVAADVAGIGEALVRGNAAAAGPTTGVLSAAADEVSTAIAALFSQHGRQYQVLTGRVAAFHDLFARSLLAGADSYAAREVANVAQVLLGVVRDEPQPGAKRAEMVHPQLTLTLERHVDPAAVDDALRAGT